MHLGVLVPLDDLRGIQDRVGRTPPRPTPEEPGLPDEIAAYLAAPDKDCTARPVEPDTEPLYVPADWSSETDEPISAADLLAAAAEDGDQYDEAEIELDIEAGWLPSGGLPDERAGPDEIESPQPAGHPPLGGSPVLPADLQLALPGLGTSTRRMPRPGDGARTDYGDHLSPEAARRLGCDAAIHRVVLGPRDVPLSAGQRTRLGPPSLRRILVARDGGCRFPGCDRPPAYTQSHHVKFWADGGPTTAQNLVLLCGFHHHRVHDHRWTLTFDGLTVTAYRPDGTLLEPP